MNPFIINRSVWELCVHTSVPAELVYIESVECSEGAAVNDWIPNLAQTTPTLRWPLLKGSAPSQMLKASMLLFLIAVCELRVWSRSWAVLQRRLVQASDSLRKSSGFVHFMNCTNVNLSALGGSSVTMRIRSSAFATQNFFGTWNVADSRTTLFFRVFPPPNLTVPEIRWSLVGHVWLPWSS